MWVFFFKFFIPPFACGVRHFTDGFCSGQISQTVPLRRAATFAGSWTAMARSHTNDDGILRDRPFTIFFKAIPFLSRLLSCLTTTSRTTCAARGALVSVRRTPREKINTGLLAKRRNTGEKQGTHRSNFNVEHNSMLTIVFRRFQE